MPFIIKLNKWIGNHELQKIPSQYIIKLIGFQKRRKNHHKCSVYSVSKVWESWSTLELINRFIALPNYFLQTIRYRLQFKFTTIFIMQTCKDKTG